MLYKLQAEFDSTVNTDNVNMPTTPSDSVSVWLPLPFFLQGTSVLCQYWPQRGFASDAVLVHTATEGP